MQDRGPWILDPGSWIQDAGPWIQDPGTANVDDFAGRDVSEGRAESNRTLVGRKRFNAIHVGELETYRIETNRIGSQGPPKNAIQYNIELRDPQLHYE